MKKLTLTCFIILHALFSYSFSEIEKNINFINSIYVHDDMKDSLIHVTLNAISDHQPLNESLEYKAKYLEALILKKEDKDKAITLLKECLVHYEITNNKKQILYCYFHLILRTRGVGQADKVVQYYKKSEEVFFENGEDEEIKILRAFILIYARKYCIKNGHDNNIIQKLVEARDNLFRFNHAQGYIDIQNGLGVVYNNRGFHESAEMTYLAALNFMDSTKYDSPISQKRLLMNLGNAYKNQGKYAEALQLQLETFESYKERDPNNEMGSSSFFLGNIGNIYYSIKDYKKALVYYKEAIAVELERENHGYKIICNQYLAIGNVKLEQKKYEEAKIFYDKSIVLAKKYKYLWQHSTALYKLGVIEYENGEKEKAEIFFSESLGVKPENGVTTSQTLYYLGETAFRKRQYRKSLDLCLRGIDNMEVKTIELIPCYECVIKNYLLLNEYENASSFQEKLIELLIREQEKSDFISIARQEVDQKLLKDSLTIQDFALSNIEQELIISRTKSTNLLLTLFLVFLSILLGFFLYFYNRRKQNFKQIRLLNESLQESNQALETLNLELEATNQNLNTANNNLHIANKSLENFASSAAHDIKAPLRTIVSFSKLIERKYSDLIKEDEFFSYIRNSAKTLGQLVDDLLDFAKLDKNLSSPVEINLNDIVSSVESSLNHSIQNSNAKIISSKAPFSIIGHPSLIYQIFLNTINNSIKFRNIERPIVININFEVNVKSNLIISIQDNGIGIKQEFLDVIFQPFRKLHSHSDYEGSGIGLASCKKVIEYYGGSIWAESVVGEGTTMYFEFPKSNIVY